MNEDGKIVEQRAEEKAAQQEVQSEEKAVQQEVQSERKHEAKYTDSDIDRIIGQKFAKWQKEKDKEISEARRLAEMNAQQKAEYERDLLRKKLDELMEKDTLSRMMAESRKELSEAGINVPDELLSMLVSTDGEKTKSAVEAFKTMFRSGVRAAVKDALRGDVPKGGNPSGLTKEDILKVGDRKERQRLMSENRQLFMNGGN